MTSEDQAHLKTLSICWYVYAGLSAIGGLCGVIYMVIGALVMVAGIADGDDGAFAGGIVFVVMAVITLVICLGFAVLFFLTAKGLANRTRKTLIYVSSVLACLNVPLGTVLGVFTFVVMSRPTVKAAFDGAAPIEDDYVKRVE